MCIGGAKSGTRRGLSLGRERDAADVGRPWEHVTDKQRGRGTGSKGVSEAQ